MNHNDLASGIALHSYCYDGEFQIYGYDNASDFRPSDRYIFCDCHSNSSHLLSLLMVSSSCWNFSFSNVHSFSRAFTTVKGDGGVKVEYSKNN